MTGSPASSRTFIAGRRFGRLVAVEFSPTTRKGPNWRCACDCGGTAHVRSDHLRSGAVLSCGCLQREDASVRHRLHGMSETAEHAIWCKMIARCTCPTDGAYPDYGGRGITVDPSWLCFPKFAADMGPRPSPEHSLDRRDNDGPYAKTNCRWATKRQQARNRRSNRIVIYQGQRMALAEACSRRGVKYSIVLQRMWRGWSFRRAMTTPPRGESCEP